MSLFTNETAAALLTSAIANIPAFKSMTFSSEDLRRTVLAAEADLSHRLKVRFEPTEVWAGTPPTQQEITDLAGKPYIEEPAYDYDPEMFQGDRWGLVDLRQCQILSVASVVFSYPGQAATWTIPPEWIRIDKKIGLMQLVPAGTFSGSSFGPILLQMLGAGRVIPMMVNVRYRCGLADAARDYPDLIDAIRKAAIVRLALESMPSQSESISLDGMSQSGSFDASKYAEQVNAMLFGPTGSNGGLWTTFHGVSVGFLG
jgi:hypothetical protein